MAPFHLTFFIDQTASELTEQGVKKSMKNPNIKKNPNIQQNKDKTATEQNYKSKRSQTED
jgi:hypothetical protein